MASNRTKLVVRTVAATLVAVALLGALGAFAFMKSGLYNIGATTQHLQPVHSVLEQGMRDSVRHHARHVVAPPLADPGLRLRGAAVFRDNCVRCHGAPGVPQEDFAKAMQPVPGPLVDAAQHWEPRELYWITRHGIKMSGMPGWEYHLADADLWAVAAFMEQLPSLTARAYAELASLPAVAPLEAPARGSGDIERGRVALTQYACNACHTIPGVTGSDVYVGRPLKDLGQRKFIAGHLPNTQENLVRWIRNPQAVDPGSAMPAQGVTERDAVDISAYLLSLR
jgi:mono/diheme cytochrome c family protein